MRSYFETYTKCSGLDVKEQKKSLSVFNGSLITCIRISGLDDEEQKKSSKVFLMVVFNSNLGGGLIL